MRIEDRVRITTGSRENQTGIVKIIDNAQRGAPPFTRSGVLVKLDTANTAEWFLPSSLVVITPRPE